MRDEDGDEDDANAEADQDEEGGVDHGEEQACLEFREGFEVVSLSFEDGIEGTGGFAGGG